MALNPEQQQRFMEQQLLALNHQANSNQQQAFNQQQIMQQNNVLNQLAMSLYSGLANNQQQQQQAMNHNQIQTFDDLLNQDESDDLEEELSDSDLGSDYDEESDYDDLEETDQASAMNKSTSQDKQGRRKSKFKLFGKTSPKLLKKLTTLKQQKEKRTLIGNNSMERSSSSTANRENSKANADDESSVWISIGRDKILNYENELEDAETEAKKNEEKNEIKMENENDKSSVKSLEKTEINNSEGNKSLNSSQSSIVQLKTETNEQINKEQISSPKATSPKLTTSLASMLFGRGNKTSEQDTKANENKKKLPNKNAPQITQVIYKRKPSLPELPIKISEAGSKDCLDEPDSIVKNSNSKQTITVPDDESTDDDPIYAEINEASLVLEEMKRSLNKHTTERKIIEMILQQPSNVQDNLLKVK